MTAHDGMVSVAEGRESPAAAAAATYILHTAWHDTAQPAHSTDRGYEYRLPSQHPSSSPVTSQPSCHQPPVPCPQVYMVRTQSDWYSAAGVD